MAEAKGISIKHTMVDKANSTIVIVVAIAAFLTIFCLVSSKILWSQASYQNRVINAKKTSLKQMQANVEASSKLVNAYEAFNSTSVNIIGGNTVGNDVKDGSNSKIVLDALPSTYDFPALATSLEKAIVAHGLTIKSIQGTDDELSQQDQASAAPEAVPMPFEFTVVGSYDSIQGLVNDLQHSIRPFQIQMISIGGNQDSMTLSLTAQTYYQPPKNLNVREKVIQ